MINLTNVQVTSIFKQKYRKPEATNSFKTDSINNLIILPKHLYFKADRLFILRVLAPPTGNHMTEK